ncbi:MAG TPA: hypothetical protein VHE61_17940 [Opitutaceae bacterium]|nr:hypothetical protein [Opitutaceae bacterium]
MTQIEPALDSFQETFCAQYGIPPARYAAIVLRLTLYPHARWLADLGPERLLAPDRSFVAGVGRLTRWRDFAAEVREFQGAPENGRFWRRGLRLRVSVCRMRALFSEVMGGSASSPRVETRSRESAGDPGSPVAG